MDWQRGAFLAPSLFHGGVCLQSRSPACMHVWRAPQVALPRGRSHLTIPPPSLLQTQRIDDATSILQQFEREHEDLARRKRLAQEELVDTVRDELEDSITALQRRHAEVLEFVRRCSVGANNFHHAASDRLRLCLADIETMRQLLDRKEERLRSVVSECLEARLSLLDDQMRAFAIAAPETEELIQRVQRFLDDADARTLISDSQMIIEEIQKQSDRIGRLPSPADTEPFDHISVGNVRSAHLAIDALAVDDDPSIFFLVPCSGNVSGGTTVRIDGSNLAGDDVKVFIGGILCDHVAIRSPHGGSSITCVTPPCQGDLRVDVIVEVDGKRATGGPSFQFYTAAPRVQSTNTVLYGNGAGYLQVPVRGEGFAKVASLNQVDLRVEDDSGNDRGAVLSHQIAQADEQHILCLVPSGEVTPGHRILASVSIAGVSSGRPVQVGNVGDILPTYSSMRPETSPGRREIEQEYTLQSQYPPPRRDPKEWLNMPSPQSRSNSFSPSKPLSRVMRADAPFTPNIGRRQHCAFHVEGHQFVWGAVGVACEQSKPPDDTNGFQWYRQV